MFKYIAPPPSFNRQCLILDKIPNYTCTIPKNHTISLLLMKSSELKKVVNLIYNSFSNSKNSLKSIYKNLLDCEEDLNFFVNSLKGKKIGYCLYNSKSLIGIVLFNLKTPTVATIINFAISLNYQGLGFGELLLKKSLSKLDPSIKSVTLNVNSDNYIAKHIYKKIGFKKLI